MRNLVGDTIRFVIWRTHTPLHACGGNLATDAFGIVAMVAMTPLITIQILGLASLAKSKRPAPVSAPVHGLDFYADDEIIGI